MRSTAPPVLVLVLVFVLVLVLVPLACGGASPPGGGAGPHDAASDAAPLPVTPAEIARRLSLYLFEERPDAELLRKVYDPPVATREDVRRLATELLADPRARAGVRRFFHLWLKLDGLATAKKDPQAFPEDSPALRAAMVEDAEAFAMHVTFDGDGRFPTLLTADFGLLEPVVAPLYGVTDLVGTERRKVALDPAQRAGIFTLPAVLANVKDGALPPISARGMFVLSLLCQEIPPEPPGVQNGPGPAPNQTARDWLNEVVGQSPACAGCHRMMDPPGLAFGNYDALGRFSESERGLPVDASGTWTLNGLSGSDTLLFDGARPLATQLATHVAVRDCFVNRWLAFAAGLGTFIDAGSFSAAQRDFEAADLDVRALIVAVTTTDAFLHP